MQVADLPNGECERLAVLDEHRILDTPPESDFDDLANLSARCCNAPIALISLIDKDRQWFKSRVGLEVRETHRDLAFCAHTILDPNRMLVVEDTFKDKRFALNPLVIDKPNIRFYAGYPLVTRSGHALGSLCVIDRQPRPLTAEQRDALRILGSQVATKLELRHARNQFSEKERQCSLLIEKLTESNAELEEFAAGASHDLKAPLSIIGQTAQWLEEDLAEHLTDSTRETLNMLHGRVRRMDILLDDLLQYASIGKAKGSHAMEIVSGDVLLENVSGLVARDGFAIQVSPAFAGIRIARMPLQQVFMNLIGNAIKHHDKKQGRIEVSVEEDADSYVFAVKDDGPGIPEQFHQRIFGMFQTLRPRDQVEGSGLGLAMVRKHLECAGRSIEVESKPGAGSTFRFSWPKIALNPAR